MTWSLVLSLTGAFGLYLTTKKLTIGFVVGLFVQILWTVYAVSTAQYGFLISVVAFGSMHILGLYRWTRPESKTKEERSDG